MPKKFNTVEERRAYFRDWHHRNKNREDYKMAQAETKKRIRKDLRVWYQDLKKNYQCSRCGIADYRVLDFHHKDPLDKVTEVGNMVRMRVSKKKILAEIAKCDCLCANCHRIVHCEERESEEID